MADSLHKVDDGKANPHNRLIDEKSPYLLQHATNPVDWYPWGDEAFEKARREDKPVFLSIGYSTCHWCHVMERESFEDDEVARLMNEAFVSIKVDREERPDIDNVYMTVCQMMTGSGGWPLTIIMTPDRKPFFAGTYIPNSSAFGRLGMVELIPRITQLWDTDRERLADVAARIIDALEQEAAPSSGESLQPDVLREAYDELSQRYDEADGGFGTAPKFPTPHNLSLLLRQWKRTGDAHALQMVEKTLQAMRRGGIYDHVGFGFHRYSTDRQWLVPHFEKMLYDQALLAIAYVETYLATADSQYADTAGEVFTYVLRDMTSPEGGFYSAEDADSEGEEGKFYVWTREELQQVLGEQDSALVAQVFGVRPDGNFAEEATGHKTGANILHLPLGVAAGAESSGASEADLRRRLEGARAKLFSTRQERIHPLKDDKILTDWNGLMIAALAIGARGLDKPAYAKAARSAAQFILGNMRDEQGRLLHRYRDKQAAIHANLDDYAFLVWGLIELYQSTFELEYLETALELNQEMLSRFGDPEAGGLYFTPRDADTILVRTKETYDGAVPAGSSVAALNLLRLGRLTGDTDLEQAAENLMKASAADARRLPSAHTQLLIAADFAFGPSHEIVLSGKPDDADMHALVKAVNSTFTPNKVVVLRPAGETGTKIERLAPYVGPMVPVDGRATAYVCSGLQCQQPTTDVGKLARMLD